MKNALYFLLIAAWILNILDIITTHIALVLGHMEGNSIAILLISKFGILGFYLLKIFLVTLALAAVYYFVSATKKYVKLFIIVMIFCSAYLLYLVMNNLKIII